jgi:hypothetical protein
MKYLYNALGHPGEDEFTDRVIVRIGETLGQAVAKKRRQLSGKIIGPPKATPEYTVEQLETMGLVGVYEPETDEERQSPQVYAPDGFHFIKLLDFSKHIIQARRSCCDGQCEKEDEPQGA